MSNVYPAWSPIADVLSVLLREKFPAELPTKKNVGLEFPTATDFTGHFVRLERLPAGGSTRLVDYPLVDVDVIAPTWAQANALSESIRMLFLGYPHSIATPAGVAVLDSVDETRSFAEVPYPGSTYRRLAATYQFSRRV
jgi:hypothetical protein